MLYQLLFFLSKDTNPGHGSFRKHLDAAEIEWKKVLIIDDSKSASWVKENATRRMATVHEFFEKLSIWYLGGYNKCVCFLDFLRFLEYPPPLISDRWPEAYPPSTLSNARHGAKKKKVRSLQPLGRWAPPNFSHTVWEVVGKKVRSLRGGRWTPPGTGRYLCPNNWPPGEARNKRPDKWPPLF